MSEDTWAAEDVALELSWELEPDIADLLSADDKRAVYTRCAEMLRGLRDHPVHGEAVGRDVSVLWCGDEAVRSLNAQWRGIDRPTDVLSFVFDEADAPPIVGGLPPDAMPLGDIIISVPKACAQAQEHGWSASDEVTFLFAHGLCHLLGHDHAEPEEAAAMAAVERYLLESIGMVRPSNVGF